MRALGSESAMHMMPTLGAQTFLIPFPEASTGKENCRTPLCNILNAESAENEQLGNSIWIPQYSVYCDTASL